MSLWLLFIGLHAASGLTAFIAGSILMSPRRVRRYPRALPVFVAGLTGLIVFMLAAMLSHWSEISLMERSIYSGLVLLAGYMMYRAVSAYRKLAVGVNDLGYIDDIGFPLISLFNGFTIVALIDLHAPIWLVVIGAVVAAVVGGQIVKRQKLRAVSRV